LKPQEAAVAVPPKKPRRNAQEPKKVFKDPQMGFWKLRSQFSRSSRDLFRVKYQRTETKLKCEFLQRIFCIVSGCFQCSCRSEHRGDF